MKRQITVLAKKVLPNNFRVFTRKLNWKLSYLSQQLFCKHAENKVYCPIAEKEFDFFLNKNGDLLSPSNGARKRQRLVWLFLKNEIKILSENYKVLHVAPELSYMNILKKQKNLQYFPGDKMVDGYSNQKGVNNIDLTELIYDDNFFDLLICNHVLEHIPDDTLAMSQMYRVLKDGGVGVITVPIKDGLKVTHENLELMSAKEREKLFGQWDHLRWYGLDIKEKFESVGFQVEVIKYGDRFSVDDYTRFGLSNDLIIHIKKLPKNNTKLIV